MKIELERTFLLKKLPKNFDKCESEEILDVYIPNSIPHPILRLRKKGGDTFELTKKAPMAEKDASIQKEGTIILSKEEFDALLNIPGKRVRKMRYYYPIGRYTAEIGIFLDDLRGLALVDVEFNSAEEKEKFKMPDFCLADVTQEEFLAGGFLAGKKYSDIEPLLDKWGYKKLIINKKLLN